MKSLIVADPIDRLNPAYDTGLAILRASLAREHDVFWARAEDIALVGTDVTARAHRATECAAGALPKLEAIAENEPIVEYDLVWIRKDPPVDWKYISLCWLLGLEEEGAVMLNRPSDLVRYHEKMLPYEACRAGFLDEEEIVPTLLLTGPDAPLPPDADDAEWVTKPWLGHGGRDIRKWKSLEAVRTAPWTQLSDGDAYAMLQRFFPDITTGGDRRIFYLGGEYRGSFVRLPAAGSIEANLARGGRAELREPTDDELDTVARLGEYLQSVGIVFAGADMIDGRITEVNITAPTGLATLRELTGADVADELVRFAEGIVESGGAWPELAR